MNLFLRIYGAAIATLGLAVGIWGAKTFYELKKAEKEYLEVSDELKAYLQKMLDEHPEWEWTDEHKKALREMGYNIK